MAERLRHVQTFYPSIVNLEYCIEFTIGLYIKYKYISGQGLYILDMDRRIS